MLTGGQMVDIPEEAIQTAHRGLRFLHTIKVPVLGADGTPKYLVGISEDITDRKRAEEELARAREQEVEIGFRIQQTLLLEQPPRISRRSRRGADDSLTAHRRRLLRFLQPPRHLPRRHRRRRHGQGHSRGAPRRGNQEPFPAGAQPPHLAGGARRAPRAKDIVTLAHAEVARQLIELESFVTLCYARFDLVERRLELVDCGHTTTIHYQAATATCRLLQGENMPLGVSESEIFEQMSVRVEPGDVFLFYSDGLTEARDAEGELFGIERLSECVRQHGRLEPKDLIEQIRLEAVAFSQSERFGDDLTCVAVRIEERRLPLARAEIEILSDLEELSRARAFVREVCTSLANPPADEIIDQLELAITEAASNVMRHAYGGRTDRRIQLEAEAFDDRIVLRLHHLGQSFDPAAVRPPVFDGTQDGGFGMYIISQSMDEVRYHRDERGRHCISMIKKR